MRAVLDPNVLISAVLSMKGAPAELLGRWMAGEYELVVSPLLLKELERALAYPKIRHRIGVGDARSYIELIRGSATLVDDASDPPAISPDPGDDYLLPPASAADAILVSGDDHVLALSERLPVLSPRTFADRLTAMS